MYNSQYYTCEQIDQRLLQGYLDDYNSQNNTNLTKEQFLTLLFNTIGRNSTVDNLVTQIGYYECDTAGSTAAKAIAVANYALFAGGSLKVKFINKNTANNATLNINSQGAKALYYQGERASATNSWDAEEVVEIYYDGTSYYANNVNGGSGSGVYDVSKEHPTLGPNDDGKFTLEYILNSSNVNELIPVNKRYPGMSIQFVSTYGNKYVQARCMANSFTTDVSQWQGVDEEPTAFSKNVVESGGVKDAVSVKKTQVLRLGGSDLFLANSYITGAGNISSASSFKVFYFPCTRGDKFNIALEGLSRSVAMLYAMYSGEPSDFSSSTLIEVSTATLADSGNYTVAIKSDDAKYLAIGYISTIPSITASKTFLVGVAEELESKVDKEEGKGLSTNDFTNDEKAVVNKHSLEDSQEYMQTTVDNDGNIIEDITTGGEKEIHIPTTICGNTLYKSEENEFVKTDTDADGNVITAVDKNGKTHFPVPTNQDDILANRILSIETKFIDIKSDKFDYHEECIFHDNFMRDIPDANRPWDIGSNSSAENLNIYDYISLYDDDIDDGFRITDGPVSEYSSDKRLVNYKGAGGRKGFRLIKNLVYNNSIVAVIENPTDNNKYEALAFNVTDVNNYELFRVYRVSGNGFIGTLLMEYVKCIDGTETITPLGISAAAYGNAIRFYFVNDSCKIFLDDNVIHEDKIDKTISNIGLFIEPTNDYSYHFFNVYYVSGKLTVMDTSQSVDKDVFNNGITQHYGQIEELDPNDEYAYHIVSDVVDYGKCERFEIRHPNGVTIDAKSDRQENGFYPQHIPMLCKYKISFDVLFPSDFVGDDKVETIWQQHASTSAVMSPCVALHVMQSELDSTKWAVYLVTQTVVDQTNSDGYKYEEEHELCFVEPGKWRHFEICIKSGYIPEHNPVSIVKIDNVVVLNTICPNAHNVSKPDYLRYGLYKAIWMYQATNTNKRVLYYDNFKVTY